MSIFLSFFGIPPYKFLLGNLLYLIPFLCCLFHPPNIHSVSNPCNISPGHIFCKVIYWLAPYYILTYFPEIQKIFSWLATKCTALTLGSIIWISSYFYQDYMTGRQILGSWGIFDSILCRIICRISSIKYWQSSNITIGRRGQFQIQKYCTEQAILVYCTCPGLFHIGNL